MAEDQNDKLIKLIEGCIVSDRRSQRELYRDFYSFSMGICLRYAKNSEEAAIIINEGFFKVFDKINSYDFNRPFITWIRTIMTNTAIDYYRSSLKFVNQTLELDTVNEHEVSIESTLDKLHYQDLLKMIRSLTPGFRTVFNLYAIEGYTHEEIADLLNISIGTSKSNLHKARAKLAELIRRSEISNVSLQNE